MNFKPNFKPKNFKRTNSGGYSHECAVLYHHTNLLGTEILDTIIIEYFVSYEFSPKIEIIVDIERIHRDFERIFGINNYYTPRVEYFKRDNAPFPFIPIVEIKDRQQYEIVKLKNHRLAKLAKLRKSHQ